MRDGISGNQRRIIKNQGASSIGRLGGSVDSGQHVRRASAARLSFPATVLRSPVGEPEFSTQAVDNPVENVYNFP